MAPRRRDSRLTLEQSHFITRIRTLGSGVAIPIYLSDGELAKLAAIVLSDLQLDPQPVTNLSLPVEYQTYYDFPLDWFEDARFQPAFIDIYLAAVLEVQDFDTYFSSLCEIHKRRKKYTLILHAQPLPKMVQIAPRALLEYGTIDTSALASWMTWRKWFYDIDNRSAQETGYLFEPILTKALGGVYYGARNSPVRRRNDAIKGRQVDCIVDRTAYEFKLRVTIAASGQGRFKEEIEFAEDCQASAYRPVLLVLDPTSSTRLEELVAEYERVGGEAFLGDEAWAHIEVESGTTMATFVEKYVRYPIAQVERHSNQLMNLSIERSLDDSQFFINLFGDINRVAWSIPRREDDSLEIDEMTEGLDVKGGDN